MTDSIAADDAVIDINEFERLLAISSYTLYMATMVANPVPYVNALRSVIKEPRVGDLVLETSTFWRRCSKHGDEGPIIGRLQKIARETAFPESDSEEDRSIMDTFWYVERRNGLVQRWYNVDFIRVLEEPFKL